MNLLLDTHALLWAASGDARLGARARQVLSEPGHALHFSAASYWEAAIKCSLGKLDLGARGMERLAALLPAHGIAWLEIKPAHCRQLLRLPWHHRDPFDRLLAAQALYEGLTLMTRDQQLHAYGVPCLW